MAVIDQLVARVDDGPWRPLTTWIYTAPAITQLFSDADCTKVVCTYTFANGTCHLFEAKRSEGVIIAEEED